jgi:uncharacterized protein YdeI (BOF family)
MPAKEKIISGIAPEDTRVSIVGTVVDFKENILVVDDGSGKIDVSFEEGPQVNSGQLVRILGRVISMEGGVELQGEVQQDFSGADLDLWRKTCSLWEESLKQL